MSGLYDWMATHLKPRLIAPNSVSMNLSWKRPLLYLLIPVFIVMVFVGFPPPLAPPAATKSSQEQAEPADKKIKKS